VCNVFHSTLLEDKYQKPFTASPARQ